MPDIKFSNKYPYTDFHELNLDWVIKEVKYWSTKVGKTIQWIDLTETTGLIDTYTIYYSDGSESTFNVTNGNGITSVAKTGTVGLVDTYTITMTDGSTTTFTVTNGAAAVDPTLTLSDYAADAKVVGNRALLGDIALTNTSQITGIYTDVNTFPKNRIVSIIVAAAGVISNLPSNFSNGTIITFDYSAVEGTGVQCQIAIPNGNSETLSYRNNWGGAWRQWRYTQNTASVTALFNSLLSGSDFKNAVDGETLNQYPFSMSMFQKIGVIGDSYASGLIYDPNIPINEQKISLSWIQVMARQFGIDAFNYSWGGNTIRAWINDTTHPTRNLNALLSGTPRDLYYICMGINESTTPADIGTIADITSDYTQNPDTFYGNMGRAIEQIAAHAPDGKIILCTTPQTGNTAINNPIEVIAQHYGIGFIKTMDDPFFSSSYYTNFYAGGHPTAPAYSGYAMAYARLTYKAIANNISYFKYFVGET